MTDTLQIALIVLAFSCVAGILLAAVMGRLNDDEMPIVEKDHEPIGDVVDVKRVISRYED